MKQRFLEGRAAVITGSTRGIGWAVAQCLAAEGAEVVVNGRDAALVEDRVASLRAQGRSAVGVPGALGQVEVAEALIGRCRSEFGRLDIVVNCAGIEEPPGSSILNIAPEDFRELIDVHLNGTFDTCRQAAPFLAETGGAIVNTSSHSYLGYYGGTGYAAGKGGVNSLTFAIAAELRDRGVAVNAICPGARTRLSSGPEYEAQIHALHARGLMNDGQRDASLSPGPPESVGPLYAVLAGVREARITGRLFTAAGGYVGLHDGGGKETMLAYRGADDGPWPVDELNEKIAAALSQA